MLYDSNQSAVKFPSEVEALQDSSDSEESKEEVDNKSNSSHATHYRVANGANCDTNVPGSIEQIVDGASVVTADGNPNEKNEVDNATAAKRRRARPQSRRTVNNSNTN